MANVTLKHGKQTVVTMLYKDANGDAVDLSSGYTAEMKLRSKDCSGGGYSSGVVDTLSTANGRLALSAPGSPPVSNIVATWLTTHAEALPNTDAVLYGDVELTVAGEVVESFTVPFDLVASTTD